jgi:hypothetical protein
MNGIKLEIDATNPMGRPICAGIDWSDAEIGHAVIICGYDSVSGIDYIYVADPGSGFDTHRGYRLVPFYCRDFFIRAVTVIILRPI